MKKTILLFSLIALASVQAAEPALKVESPWVFAVPPTAKDTAAFMTLVNSGSVPIRITGGKTDVAARVAPMITTKTEGRMGMKDVPYIEVPAGGRATLAPGGDHIMIYGLKAPLKPGQNISLVLTVQPGGTMMINALVSRREPK
jgi:copper(I)-binding protein